MATLSPINLGSTAAVALEEPPADAVQLAPTPAPTMAATVRSYPRL